jgi:hypothetical protein
VRAEFTRREDGSEVVATAVWDGRRVLIDSSDSGARGAVERIFRSTPVVVDDASFRSLGARGESVIQPGSLEWFLAAAFGRAEREGFAVRVVPEVAGQGGWDPAAAYRTFREDMARLIARGTEQPDAQ